MGIGHVSHNPAGDVERGVTVTPERWSFTATDLTAGPEPGRSYPRNGKGTPLESDTTCGKGAGVVGVVTYDAHANVEVRHHGQPMPYPTATACRYAAVTVPDGDGRPVVMPWE